MRLWTIALAAIAAVPLAPLAALGAANGSIGSTSSGSANLNAHVNVLVQISGLNDILLGSYTGSGGLTGRDGVCVYSQGTGYQLVATGSGTAGAFTLTAGEVSVPYTVQWGASGTATSGTALTSGSPVTVTSGSYNNLTCGGGSNASVIITVTDEAVTNAPSGTYSGTLTLTLSPF